jgi:hypothetical protein
MFAEGQRPDLGADVLEAHVNGFTSCPSCGLYNHRRRKSCPGCQKAASYQAVDLSYIISKKDVDGNEVQAEVLFRTDGVLLHAQVLGSTVLAIEFDGKATMLHIVGQTRKRTLKLWDNLVKGFRFRAFDRYLLAAGGTDLLVFDFSGDAPAPVARTTTLCYDEEPVFGASAAAYYRLTDKMLMQGTVQNGSLVEKGIESVMEDQTWFAVGDNGLGLGFFRIFSKFHHFVFSPKGRYEVALPALPGKLIEWDAKIYGPNVLLLRKTLDQGRTWSHSHLLDETGTVLEEKTEESLNSELLKNLFGKALAGRTTLHPTEAGMVVEKKGALVLKRLTAEYVNGGSRLEVFRDGVCSVSDKDIVFLRSKEKGA